jgi:hypothetical protein
MASVIYTVKYISKYTHDTESIYGLLYTGCLRRISPVGGSLRHCIGGPGLLGAAGSLGGPRPGGRQAGPVPGGRRPPWTVHRDPTVPPVAPGGRVGGQFSPTALPACQPGSTRHTPTLSRVRGPPPVQAGPPARLLNARMAVKLLLDFVLLDLNRVPAAYYRRQCRHCRQCRAAQLYREEL